MKNLTQKTVSLLLVAVFILALALSAVAAVPDEGEVAPTAACNHVYQWLSNKATGTYRYYSTLKHCEVYEKTGECRLCGITVTETYPNSNVKSDHTSLLETASCNGTTQTLNYSCKTCHHTTISRQIACPGAPHGVVCRWLPL